MGFLFLILLVLRFSNLLFLLDKGTLYVAEGGEIEMRCQNKTKGTFANLVWLSNAYQSEGKKTVYSVAASGVVYVKPIYQDRVVRFNGTSIQIKNARSEDSGSYECNIVFKIDKLKVEMLAVYDLVVIGKYILTHFEMLQVCFWNDKFYRVILVSSFCNDTA